MKGRLILAIIFLATIFGCRAVTVKKRVEMEKDREEEIIRKIELAEDYYAKGVVNNIRRNFKEARSAFDSALSVISEIELLTREEDKAYKERINTLLREIAHDYRFALLGTNVIDSDNAPAVLAYALEESLDEKRLKELASKLKEVPEKVDYDIPMVWSDEVKEKIIYIQTEIRKPFTRWLSNSTRYVPIFREILKRNGVPLDLAYLPLIESGYEPNAYSWAHAVGIWQFIASTAKIYGLEVNWWVDERRDPIKSTEAACRYLKKLYNQFGDWQLALAAYNCGELRVEREIKKASSRAFSDLSLPRQTKNYVPLFMAALFIAKNPELFGFNFENQPVFEYDSVEIEGGTDLRVVAKCADTTYEAIKFLNPQYLRFSLPPNRGKYWVRLPRGKYETFVYKFKLIPEEKKRATFAEHKVKKGETISSIAAKYGISTDALITANKITNPRALPIGARLLIPLKEGANLSRSEYAESGSTDKPSKKNFHIVKSGDTIGKISKAYNVPVDKILKLNNLSMNSVIHPGDTILITDDSKSGLVSNGGSGRTKLEHIVQKGESLYGIARKYGVSVDELVDWNALPSKDVLLRVGQRLFVYGVGTKGGELKKEKVLYTVKRGDSLFKIAKMFNVSVEEIMRWNNLNGKLIRENQRLVLYKERSIESKKRVYIVKPGDTLWSIASSFGVTVESIIRANGFLDPHKIKAGDELAIYINE